MKLSACIILIIFLLLLLGPEPGLASDGGGHTLAFATAGLGSFDGLSLNQRLSYARNGHMLSEAYYWINYGTLGPNSPVLELNGECWSLGLMYGRYFEEGVLLASITAGPSYIKGMNGDFLGMPNLGFHIQGDVMLRSPLFIGIGGSMFTILNRRKTIYGILLTLPFGKIR